MDNVYELHEVTDEPIAKIGITIRRKPSQIPHSIDWPLMKIAGMTQLDGPNNRVTYLFSHHDRLVEAVEFLQKCGWSLRP